MEKSKTLYCEYAFLEDFSKSCPKRSDDPLEDPVSSWRSAFKFIQQSERVIGKLSLSDYKEIYKTNPLLWLLIKGSRPGNFSSTSEILNEKLNNKKSNSIFLSLLSEEKRVSLSKTLGVLIFGKRDLLNFDIIFRDLTIPIPKGGKYSSWKDIEFPFYVNYSNSLLIQDNYILKDEIKKKNLITILDVILPEKTSITYSISIFTMIEKNEKAIYVDLVTKIGEIRPSLDFKLTLYKVFKDEFHARRILTNNILICSEIGFDVFNKKNEARIETDVRCLSPYVPLGLSLVENMMNGIKRIEKRGLRFEFNYWGDETRENRLISYYLENADDVV